MPIETIRGQDSRPTKGHYYTATEVRQRLEKEENLYRGSSGYNASGVSGVPLWQYEPFESKIIKPLKSYAAERLRQEVEDRINMHKAMVDSITCTHDPVLISNKNKPFTIRGFVREAVRELKEYFIKKEK